MGSCPSAAVPDQNTNKITYNTAYNDQMSKQKNYKNGIAIQQDRQNGKFITTPKSILLDKNLTDKAKVLFQLMVDTPSDSKISLEYYRKLLGWRGKDTMTSAFENLRVNGYARYEQHPKGKGNGFTYSFVLSEYANLKVEDKPTEPELKDSEAEIGEPIQLALEPIKTTKQINDEGEKLLQEFEAHIKEICDEKMEGGTISQRKETFIKMLKFGNTQLENGIVMTDGEIRDRIFKIHYQTKTANRVIDQKYND